MIAALIVLVSSAWTVIKTVTMPAIRLSSGSLVADAVIVVTRKPGRKLDSVTSIQAIF